MKILLINKYFYIKGGAENSFFQMAKLLEKKGHEVVFFAMESPRNFESPYSRYFISHVDYDNHSLPNILKCSGRMLYSWEARRGLEELIAQEKPDIAHLNNIYHQISPSIIHSLKKYRVPMVMSLRDYKLVCASYSMVHQGVVCEACKDGRYYHAFSKKCVKGSLMKSLLNTSEMYLHHKMLNIYDDVDMFISPSRFLKSKVNEMGFKKEIKHLFNFVNLDEFNPEFHWSQRTAVFFGRLSHEKGVATLIRAFKGINGLQLKIIGEGPLRPELEKLVANEKITNVIFSGYKSGDDLYNEIKKSMFVVLPSEWYENNPRNIIEGFALGKPAVAADIGGIPELVIEGQTGYLYPSGNVDALRAKLDLMMSDEAKLVEMGRQGRKFVEEELNEEAHYQGLKKIYDDLLTKNTVVNV